MAGLKIPYYHVNPYGKGHWKPGPNARKAGFRNIACGRDGPAARTKALAWYNRWTEARTAAQTLDLAALSWEDRDDLIVYPQGSIGAGFQEFRQIHQLWVEQKADRTREEWGRCWKHLSVYAEAAPDTMTVQIIVDLRTEIEQRHGADLAYRCIKIWRALWNELTRLGYASRPDPSLAIRNAMPKGRTATWTEGEAVRMIKQAWRDGYCGMAVLMAIAWDTQLSVGDVRALSLAHRRRDGHGTWFESARSKTAKAFVGTLSRRSERLLAAYLDRMPAIPLNEPFLRNRSGGVYLKNKASEDFRLFRERLFPGDKRQMRDFRRSGAVEALEGDAPLESIGMKMANDLATNRELQATYLPSPVAKVRKADAARVAGRSRMRDKKG